MGLLSWIWNRHPRLTMEYRSKARRPTGYDHADSYQCCLKMVIGETVLSETAGAMFARIDQQ